MAQHFTPNRMRIENGFLKALPFNAAYWRREALMRFAEKGLPHRRIESWRYTDLREKMKNAPEIRLVDPPDAHSIDRARARAAALSPPGSIRCVFIDGFFIQALSDVQNTQSGLLIRAIPESQSETVKLHQQQDSARIAGQNHGQDFWRDDALVSLNTALAQGGAAIEIAAGARIEPPIALISLFSQGETGATFSRSVIHVGEGASVRFIELGASLDDDRNPSHHKQSHEALVFSLANDAHVELVSRIASGTLIHLHSLLVEMGARAHFSATHLIMDAYLVRRQIFARLQGQSAKLSLRGLSLLEGRDHADATLVVEHNAPGCESREFFRHILKDESVGVFQGRISVQPLAQKTDGVMKSEALLLNDGVAMFNKPELEIFADDVVCGHGATAGTLDADQIFYLMSRGLSHAEAEALLLEAFASEILETIADEDTRVWLLRDAKAWLDRKKADRRKSA